jgi:predicted metal-dependent enzyme (double-stranded beta helix superfamily)
MTTDLDQLTLDCRAALDETSPRSALREVLERAVSRPAHLAEILPAPRQQSVVVHLSDELSILQVVNEPGFAFHPHDHGSWSACAFYAGRERNTFYRRTPNGLEIANGKEYGEGDVFLMGADVVHSIENPLRTNNAALHVFAGNPFTAACSQWDPQTLEQAPFDTAYAMTVYPSPPA